MHLYMFSYRGPHVWIWYGLCTSSLTLSYQCGLPISVGFISLTPYSLHFLPIPHFLFYHSFSSIICFPLDTPSQSLKLCLPPFQLFFLFLLVFPLLSSSPIIHLHFILLSINPFSFLSHFLIPPQILYVSLAPPFPCPSPLPFTLFHHFFVVFFFFPFLFFPSILVFFTFCPLPFYPLPSWTPRILSLACLLCLSFINSFPSFSCFFKHIYILFPSLTNFNTTWNDAYH